MVGYHFLGYMKEYAPLGMAAGSWLPGTLAGFSRKPLCPCLHSASPLTACPARTLES